MKYIIILTLIFLGAGTKAQQANIGDVKLSFRQSDHEGWFLLNGRSIGSIANATAAASATSLGLTALPDARNKFLKGKTSAEAIGAAGGSSSILISQANLPAFAFTPSGATDTKGAHTHTVSDLTPYYPGNSSIGYLANAANYLDSPNASTTVTSSTDGAHAHNISVSSGGSGMAIATEPNNITVNTFVYLGGN